MIVLEPLQDSDAFISVLCRSAVCPQNCSAEGKRFPLAVISLPSAAVCSIYLFMSRVIFLVCFTSNVKINPIKNWTCGCP